MLKKSASVVLGPLSCSQTPVYPPHAKSPHSPFDKGGEGDFKALFGGFDNFDLCLVASIKGLYVGLRFSEKVGPLHYS